MQQRSDFHSLLTASKCGNFHAAAGLIIAAIFSKSEKSLLCCCFFVFFFIIFLCSCGGDYNYSLHGTLTLFFMCYLLKESSKGISFVKSSQQCRNTCLSLRLDHDIIIVFVVHFLGQSHLSNKFSPLLLAFQNQQESPTKGE